MKGYWFSLRVWIMLVEEKNVGICIARDTVIIGEMGKQGILMFCCSIA